MIEDTRKELEQLEKQLLEDEEWFQRELDSAKRLIGQNPDRPAAPQTAAAPANLKEPPVRNYANGYGQGAPKAKRPEPVVEEAPMPKRKGTKGLLILATLETLGILGLIAYWVLFLLK